MYYVYFIEPLPNCEYVAFGRTRNLGDRWSKYRNACPNPQLLGLIKCETINEMNILERHIKHQHLKAFIYRNEWLHHTPEVIAFYQEQTNIDIEKTLADAIETHNAKSRQMNAKSRQRSKERRQKLWQDPVYRQHMSEQQRERYQNDLEYRERRREYQREYRQRSGPIQEAQRQRERARRQTPEYREKERARKQTPEYREYRRESNRKRRQRKKRSAAEANGQLELFQD